MLCHWRPPKPDNFKCHTFINNNMAVTGVTYYKFLYLCLVVDFENNMQLFVGFLCVYARACMFFLCGSAIKNVAVEGRFEIISD